ncbi:MAG: hypothetical protein UD936_00880 [Acutalibacteraceae bacterium]|nr:hypothetical protein [Acutalibacteraceae bacterium]
MFDWNGNGKKDLFDSYIDYKIFESVFEEESDSYDPSTYNPTYYDYYDDYDTYDSTPVNSTNNYKHSTLDLDDSLLESIENEGDALKSEKESTENKDDYFVFSEKTDIILGKIIYAIYIISGFMVYVSILGIFQAPLKLWFIIFIISLPIYLFLRKVCK